MTLIPSHFLFRFTYPCLRAAIPLEQDDRLLDLPERCRIDNYAGMAGRTNFTDIRLAWNELGLGVQLEVRGKEQLPQGNAARPGGSDGLTLWIDTRDARTSHRASRYCHQLHFLPAGGGPDRDEPAFVQAKINRASQDSPHSPASAVPLQCAHTNGGYILEAFLSAAVLHGYDPEQNRRLGFYYVVKDQELGDQVLGISSDFPYWEDPSLWSVLELTGKAAEPNERRE